MSVEFALILPILLLLVFGLIQYGFYFWSMQGGSAAAREAARRAAVGQLPDCGEFTDYVVDRIGVTRDPDTDVDIIRTYSRPVVDPDADPDDIETDIEPAAVQVGDVVTVTVEFHSYDMNLPLVPFIDGGRVRESADSRVEYTYPEAPPEDCP